PGHPAEGARQRNPRCQIDPAAASIAGHMDPAVIGAGVQQAGFEGRFGQGGNRMSGVLAWTGFALRQIGADNPPLPATVQGLENMVPGCIKEARAVGRNQKGGGPVEAVLGRAVGRPGRYAGLFFRAQIEAAEFAVLDLRINPVLVDRIDNAMGSIPPGQLGPNYMAIAFRQAGGAWTIPAAVILQSPVNAIGITQVHADA